MEIFKILAVCLITALLAVMLKQYRSEYAVAVVLVGGIAVMLYVFKLLYTPFAVLKSQLEAVGIELEYFKIALKALGIGYITNFIADACRDSGQVSMASKAELGGKCAVFLVCLPMISKILQTAIGFLQ